jgi:hypothetical protein
VNIHIKRGHIISDKRKARCKYIAVNLYLISSRCQLWNIKEVLRNKYRCSFGERGDMYSRIKKICRKEIFKRNPIESISDVIK